MIARSTIDDEIHQAPPATLSASIIVELCARLRLACAAVGPDGIRPEDVSLDDLAPAERARLTREGEADFWKFINQTEQP